MQFFPSQLFCGSHHPHTKYLCVPPTRADTRLKKLEMLPHFFFSLPQTVLICHWVCKGISHERQWLFKVLSYLSNLKYRTSVLRQDFPALFNRDSSTHFEDVRLESKPRSHKRKITETLFKAYYRNKKKMEPRKS